MASIIELTKKTIFWEILQGMGLTFRYMWTKPITMRYPDERWIPADRFRGQVGLVRDPKTPDQDLCVGCCLCVRVCPSRAINMVTSMDENNRKIIDEHFIDLSRCIFCGMCAEICPVNALISTDRYEMASYTRDTLMLNKKKLLEEGHACLKRKAGLKAQGINTQTVIK